jgi:hypothetical protein
MAVYRDRLHNPVRRVHRQDAAVEQYPCGRIGRKGVRRDEAGGESYRNDFP